MALRGEPSRWLVGLSALIVFDAAIGVGIWLLSSHVWHWPRADVIAITVGVAAVVGALGIAPVSSWATGRAEPAVRQGVEISRSRAKKGSIKVRAKSVRIDRSRAGTDIEVTQDSLPVTAPNQDGDHAS
jgi:hypothetical protein